MAIVRVPTVMEEPGTATQVPLTRLSALLVQWKQTVSSYRRGFFDDLFFAFAVRRCALISPTVDDHHRHRVSYGSD